MDSNNKLPFILVVSDIPPIPDAADVANVSSGIVLNKLFSNYPHDSIAYATSSNFRQDFCVTREVRNSLNKILVFPVSFHGFKIPGSESLNCHIHELITRQLVRLCEKNGAEIIFVSPMNYGFLLSPSIEASQRVGIPLVVYFMDDLVQTYKMNWPSLSKKAQEWQTKALNSADFVYTNGPGMQSMYQKLYGIDSSILTNVINLNDYISVNRNSSNKSKKNVYTILYTGSVYGAQLDAIDNLVKALDIVNKLQIICEFHLYSNLLPSSLNELGWSKSYVKAKKAVKTIDLSTILGNADLLFLPLSFKPEWRFTVQTSAPGKLAEYAGSGRPILIHAPSYADISILGKERHLGIVVENSSPQELAEALLSLINNESYASQVGQQANDAAHIYYNQSVIQQKLYSNLMRIVMEHRKNNKCNESLGVPQSLYKYQ
jgi:glycosyltransferase involved in cell wall biosynthesis